MKHTPQCIKCKKTYDSDEPDAYYCSPCNKSRIKIAEEVDKRIASRPRRSAKSDWKTLEETGVLNVPGGRIVSSIPSEYDQNKNKTN